MNVECDYWLQPSSSINDNCWLTQHNTTPTIDSIKQASIMFSGPHFPIYPLLCVAERYNALLLLSTGIRKILLGEGPY